MNEQHEGSASDGSDGRAGGLEGHRGGGGTQGGWRDTGGVEGHRGGYLLFVDTARQTVPPAAYTPRVAVYDTKDMNGDYTWTTYGPLMDMDVLCVWWSLSDPPERWSLSPSCCATSRLTQPPSPHRLGPRHVQLIEGT